jgi:hypothetical protein
MTTHDSTMTARRAIILEAAFESLTGYASAQRISRSQDEDDSGPVVLAALTDASVGEGGHEGSQQALAAWLDRLRATPAYTGVFGGLAGLFVGLHVASSFHTRLERLAVQLRGTLTNELAAGRWRTTAVAWEDYDLISGPAGIILALATDRGCPPGSILPAARHLAYLCDRDDLERLRVGAYREDIQRGWNFGRINTGLAHGVAGVAAALRSACETAESREEFVTPLRRVCDWLVSESYVDGRGLRTWHPAGLERRTHSAHFSRRQAWCYGTPGVAWTLWEAGRVLGDIALQSFARDAMSSFCTVFDERFYVDDGPVDSALGICHGVAGTIAIADAFTRHAGLHEAAILRDRLEDYLLDRLDDVRHLAARDMTLLTGASGILAVLLTRYGGRRDWLFQFALR